MGPSTNKWTTFGWALQENEEKSRKQNRNKAFVFMDLRSRLYSLYSGTNESGSQIEERKESSDEIDRSAGNRGQSRFCGKSLCGNKRVRSILMKNPGHAGPVCGFAQLLFGGAAIEGFDTAKNNTFTRRSNRPHHLFDIFILHRRKQKDVFFPLDIRQILHQRPHTHRVVCRIQKQWGITRNDVQSTGPLHTIQRLDREFLRNVPAFVAQDCGGCECDRRVVD